MIILQPAQILGQYKYEQAALAQPAWQHSPPGSLCARILTGFSFPPLPPEISSNLSEGERPYRLNYRQVLQKQQLGQSGHNYSHRNFIMSAFLKDRCNFD